MEVLRKELYRYKHILGCFFVTDRLEYMHELTIMIIYYDCLISKVVYNYYRTNVIVLDV